DSERGGPTSNEGPGRAGPDRRGSTGAAADNPGRGGTPEHGAGGGRGARKAAGDKRGSAGGGRGAPGGEETDDGEGTAQKC
ncbi:hypothetical protein C3R31_21110, partial [Mycobacterium tuberculosis]